MKTIDNINETLKNDLIDKVKKGSRISIIASCFSMYAYKELKKQLDGLYKEKWRTKTKAKGAVRRCEAY